MQIDPKTLRLFLAVIESRTIAGAAKQMHIAPAAISKRIQDLENQLSVQLLIRSNKGVQPTPAAYALADMAQRTLSDLNNIALQMRNYADGITGKVHIAANISSIIQFLPDKLQHFMGTHPLVEVSLEEQISTRVATSVANKKADIGLLVSGVAAENLEYYNFKRDELVIVSADQHPVASLQKTNFASVLDFDFVGLYTRSQSNELLLHQAARLGRAWRCRVQVTSFDAQCRMVQAGLGIAIMPKKIASFFVRELNLKTCQLDEPWAQRQLVLAVRNYNQLLPTARLLVDHLLNNSPTRADLTWKA